MSTSDAEAAKRVQAARAEAAVWITRLHGPGRSTELEAGLRRWLAERAENAAEFEALTAVWDLAGNERVARGVPRLRSWTCGDTVGTDWPVQPRRPHSPPAWAYAAVLLVCVLGAFGAHRFFSAPDYSTTIGEQRSMQLSDGTHVALNSETQLTIAYETARRVVHLTRGEAFFDVAKDAQRPFIVIAGAHRVTALGTSFVVRFDSVRTAVTLLEGKVAVSGPADDSAAPADVLLNAGQRVVMTPTEPPKVDAPRIEVVTAWRRGEVILDDSPLAEAVAEMNRYDRTVIVIDDAQIEGLLVSGLYHAGDNEGFARTLARMYHLDLAIVDGRIHLREITR